MVSELVEQLLIMRNADDTIIIADIVEQMQSLINVVGTDNEKRTLTEQCNVLHNGVLKDINNPHILYHRKSPKVLCMVKTVIWMCDMDCLWSDAGERMDHSRHGSMLLLLFATTRSVFKSVKVSVVEIAKRTN